MTVRSTCWGATLVVLLPLAVARGEDGPWRTVKAIPAPGCVGEDVAPSATLGRPKALTSAPVVAAPFEFLGQGLAPVSYNEPEAKEEKSSYDDVSPLLPPPPDPPPPTIYTANQAPESVSPPPSGPMSAIPPPGDVPVNNGVVIDKPLQHSFWDKCKDFFTKGGEGASASGRCPFQSDHCFDYLASPVTNPFLFEDPRALTELRPVFIYQGAPSGNPIFRGGNSEYYGLQARLAFTERLSLVINQFGFVSLNPNDPGADPSGKFSKSTGFGQITLGPKYTFWRCDDWHSIAAGGLMFQIPAGSSRVFQDTGTLSLVPYLTAAKNFGLGSGWGSINVMGTTGYSASVDRQRSSYFYMSAHVDYNIANTNMFFPFLEMNWYHYTQGGKANDPGFGFEGTDLVNFGSHSLGGRDFLTIAPGLRFKLNEHIQAGAAIEFPLLKQKEITDYRLTFDLIFRY
jgi:hypothetical protein